MEIPRDNTLGKLVLIQDGSCIKYVVTDTIKGFLILAQFIKSNKDIDKDKLNVCRVSTNKLELSSTDIPCIITNYRARTFILSFNNVSIKAKQII